MHLDIYTYSTHFTFDASPQGRICGNAIDLNRLFFDYIRIPIFDRMGKYINEIRYFTYRHGKFHVPIETLSLLREQLDPMIEQGIKLTYTVHDTVVNPHKEGGGYLMREGWKDRVEHREAFDHLLNYPGHQVGNNLQTGKGKSYLGVKLSIIYDTPTLVCCDGLTEQWEDNFIEKTTIPKDKIYTIQGIASLKKLWKKIKNQEELPWIILGSIKTLSLYRIYKSDNYREFPRINDLCVALGIGHVIFDEVHLNTHACVLLLTNLSINKNTFLSATPERSSKKDQKVFSYIFPGKMIGGSAKYDRYVTSMLYGYDLNLNCPESRFTSFGYGYSHVKYESVIMSDPYHIAAFSAEVLRMLTSEYLSRKTDGDKCIIFVSTVRLASELAKRIGQAYNALDVRTYLSSDPIDNLYNADVVVSTPKSCGVGKDIKGLITVINTVSTKSNPLYKQMLGRLRKIDNKVCKFIDMVNNDVGTHMKHYWAKRRILKGLSKQFTEEGIRRKT